MPIIFKEYQIHRISKDRLFDLLILFKSAFNQKVSLSYLEKKFDTERFGASFVGYIAYTQTGEPAAYYGVFPIRFKLNSQVLRAAQSGDTMTHKDHQHKGLFIELAKMTYDLARKEGIKLIFGFPNENSLPGFIKKLNWTIDGKLHFYKQTVYTFPFAALMHLVGLKSVYLRYFNFWAKLLGLKSNLKYTTIDRNNSIYYDQDGIAYRTFSDNYFLEEKESVIWIKVVRTMQIGCIFNTDDEHAAQLLNRLKWLSVITGLIRISFWCTDNHPNLRVIQSRFNKYNYYQYGHLNLTNSLTQHHSFFYEACDGDTY
ncbi:MAG: GNAT family N-acetyltransferase [Kiritimatiellae bacterium]|nr:GNAT family N-acetyltransferase [Kiritimatiellia bacterium]MDD5521807.1 GNAT family N-acetyltransferase [Kiritimatiellia bacterium]